MAEPPPPEISPLQPGRPGELTATVRLLDAELGRGLYREHNLEFAAADNGALVLLARERGEVVGVAIARLQAEADAAYYGAFGAEAARAFDHSPVGSLEALAVAPSARGRGLGEELIRARLRWFRARGCGAAVALAWMPVTHPAGYSASLFRRLGFIEGPAVADFYRAESEEDGWSCPADGHPCRCPAVFFWLPLPTNRQPVM